jgi:hypothetical protein
MNGRSKVIHKGGASDESANAHYYRSRNRFLAHRRDVSICGKRESLFSLITEQLYRASINGIPERKAMHDGLLDGLSGRFGKRHKPWPQVIRRSVISILTLIILPYRMRRKLQRRFSIDN